MYSTVKKLIIVKILISNIGYTFHRSIVILFIPMMRLGNLPFYSVIDRSRSKSIVDTYVEGEGASSIVSSIYRLSAFARSLFKKNGILFNNSKNVSSLSLNNPVKGVNDSILKYISQHSRSQEPILE